MKAATAKSTVAGDKTAKARVELWLDAEMDEAVRAAAKHLRSRQQFILMAIAAYLKNWKDPTAKFQEQPFCLICQSEDCQGVGHEKFWRSKEQMAAP